LLRWAKPDQLIEERFGLRPEDVPDVESAVATCTRLYPRKKEQEPYSATGWYSQRQTEDFNPCAPRRSTARVQLIELSPDDPIQGPATAPVTLVEWGDFQCAFSGQAEATLQQLRARYGDQLRLVWLNLPMASHAHGRPAARAALAARLQGRFWQLHDLLLATQPHLTDGDLEQDASNARLDLTRWREALASEALEVVLERDIARAQAVGVVATPTFFINGIRVNGAQDFAYFSSIIDEQLRRAALLRSRGVPPEELYGKLEAQNVQDKATPSAKP
jgi:protein-disulfide isomerase